MYFSLSAWRRVRDSSHVCFGRKNEAAVGDLLLPMGKHQSLVLDSDVRELTPTLEIAGAIVCAFVFAARGVIPLDSQPFTIFVGYRADVTDNTCLLLQTQALAYVWSDFNHYLGLCCTSGSINKVVLSCGELKFFFGLCDSALSVPTRVVLRAPACGLLSNTT
jgi:hypothetical protein